MQHNSMTFGQRLKRRLSEKNMTQKLLSELLNIPQGTLSTYFRDKNEPDIETMVKLADALDTTVEYLTTGKKVAPSSLISGELATMLEDEKLRTFYERLILLDDDNLELAAEQLDAIIRRQSRNDKK